MAAAAGARRGAGGGRPVTILDRLRCAFLGRPCPAPWAAEHDPVLVELREHAERANREADALRERRLSWERVYGLGEGRGGARDAG